VRLLANPIVMRMGLGLLVSIAAFVIGLFGLRALRRKIVDDDLIPENFGTDDTTYAYSAVIQQLKQQKFELQNEHAIQKRRAKTSDHITAAVIASLPCGVLFIGANGLVKQANAAARQLLGFASPLGMGLDDLFRDTDAVPESGETTRLADVVKSSLRERSSASFKAPYETAAGEQKDLSLTLIPLSATADDAAGLACVIADETSVAQSQRERLLRSEISAELALHMRSSLSVIRDCAEKIGADSKNTPHLAVDIAAEADRLDKFVRESLAEHSATKAAAARA
jgi:PAS domain-containing protein